MIIAEKFDLQKEWKDIIPKKTSILSTGFYADISKIKKEISWKSEVTIKEGIKNCFKNIAS